MWREQGRLGLVVATFSGALVLGGCTSVAVVWLAAGLVSWVPAWVGLTVLGTTAAAVVLHELGALTLRLPSTRRQVPQEVFTNGPYLAAIQFGFELGTGVRTYLPSYVPYLAVVAVLALGPGVAGAAACGIGFGLGRAAMAVTRTFSPDPFGWDESLRARERTIKLVSLAAALLAIASLL